MTIWIILSIVGVILFGVFLFACIKSEWESTTLIILFILDICLVLVSIPVAIVQPFSMRQTQIRYKKEREQILFQIDHLTPETDKIKLNEWILSYNDWVNDINSGKETWGIFDWYYCFDMSGHEIIQLV